MKKILIEIEGMHCEGCKNRVLSAVKPFKFVDAKVDLNKKTLTASLKKDVDKSQVASAIEDCGFEVKNIDIC